MRKHDVIIIGGGISGASALHWLASAGLDVLLLERTLSLGGVMGSRRNEHGALVETGPNSVQARGGALLDLIEDLGLAGAIVLPGEAAANRYIMRDGEIHAVPTGPKALFRSSLFSGSAKFRLLREPFVAPVSPDAEESVAQFVERRLGREVLDYAVNPFVSGVYAGRPEHLSVRYAFPLLHELERTSGSLVKGGIRRAKAGKKAKGKGKKEGMEDTREGLPQKGIFSFAGGMGTLPRAIEERWRESIRFGASAEQIERDGGRWIVTASGETYAADHLIVATEAQAASGLIAHLDHVAASALRSIEHPPVAVASVLYDREAVAHPLDGFGLLIPEVEKRHILGVIFSSSLFPDRAPEGTVLLNAFIGGARSPELALRSREEMLYDVHGELRRTFGISARPRSFDLQVWPRAIPQYNLGYGTILAQLSAAEDRLEGLHLLGSYRGGVAVGDCVASARALAERIAATRPVLQQQEADRLEEF